jgi:hypothetical protein
LISINAGGCVSNIIIFETILFQLLLGSQLLMSVAVYITIAAERQDPAREQLQNVPKVVIYFIGCTRILGAT